MVQKKRKTTNAFLNMLAIISILGFLAIALNAFTKIDLNPFVPAMLLIILGVGFIIEGEVRKWNTTFKNGITGNEFTHLITGIIGLLAIVIGIISLFVKDTPVFIALMGIFAIIAIIVISIETWLVK